MQAPACAGADVVRGERLGLGFRGYSARDVVRGESLGIRVRIRVRVRVRFRG